MHAAIFLLTCAVIVSRRPDIIFHAQPYAEDGQVLIGDAYNLGWLHALLLPWRGCFITMPRLGAALALLGPLSTAPLVLNLLALAVEALPVNLLLSARSASWGGLHFRALMALLYLAMPNCAELGCGITESIWFLALSAYLVLVADVPHGWVGRCFDISILLLSGLSGPFCIFLMPIAVFLAWRKRREPMRWAAVGLLSVCSLAQIWSVLVLDWSGRPHGALGAGIMMFVRIIGGQIVLGALLGGNRLGAMPGSGVLTILVCSVIAGAVISAYCFFRSPLAMKLFFLLSAEALASSLLYPATSPDHGLSVWEKLAATANVRYWFFPILAFMWALLWCAWRRNKVLRPVSLVLLGVMCLTVPLGWRFPALKDTHFAEYARNFEAAPAGTVLVIPGDPQGWETRLVKHASK
jgi:hypothetical protein